jgi:hypothetical protein
VTAPVATGMSLALPRARALTDALVAPAESGVSAEELAALRAQVAGDLAALVEELPAGERLRLDAYRFALARDDPERMGSVDGPFVPSPVTCRRTVGVSAVARCVRRWAPSPAVAVDEVLAAGVEDSAAGSDPARRPPRR